jgi:hypothetical protein
MITCVVPTRNEARNLPHAIASLRWCDEVIVVDMESSDGTPELARSLGANVLHVEYRPDFDMSRKVGLDAARAEWVLALDADEIVPRPLAEAISELVRGSQYDVALIPRVNFKFGLQRGGSLWPDYQRRLYRKGAVEFVSAIHRYLEIKSSRVKWFAPQGELALYHFNYSPLEQQLHKLNKYTSTEALFAPRNTAVPPAWSGLARFASLHFKHGAWREGIPGLWWSGQASFYDLAQRRKRLEVIADGTMAGTEGEIAQLNRETSAQALAAVQQGQYRCEASFMRLAYKLLSHLGCADSSQHHIWVAACAAFRDLTLEVKVWEMTAGRAMAERAQDEMRAVLMELWAKRTV